MGREDVFTLSHLHGLTLDLVIDVVFDLCSEFIRGMRTCSCKIVTADDWPENLVMLIVLQVVVAIAFDYSYNLLRAFPHIGRAERFVRRQRGHINLIAVVGIHS